MSSSQYSTVLHKRNATPGLIPSLTALSAGELAINEFDGNLFIRTVSNTIETFLNKKQFPHILNQSLSSVVFQYGHNVVSQVLSNVLGGYANNITGAASTIVNGESNNVSGDFAFIGAGTHNRIVSAGDFSAILGGHHNLVSHANSFVLGSNLSSHAENFTYVNNISGIYYGDGSNLTGIVTTSPVGTYLPLSGGIIEGDLTITGLFSSVNSEGWQSVYTSVRSNSALWSDGGGGTDSLSSYNFFGDGITTIFELDSTIPHTNAAGYIVSLNGAAQVPYKDYTITYSSGTNKLNTEFVPPSGSEISVVYLGNRINSITAVTYEGGIGSDVSSLSSNWQNTYSNVLANSATWNTVTDVKSLTGVWQHTYSSVLASSATWNTVTDVKGLSSNWQNTYSNVLANSATWNVILNVELLSSNWENTYSSVLASSAVWNTVTDVKGLSSNWQNTYSNVLANSGLWSNMLPTSGGTIQGNLLVTGSLSVLSGSTFINTTFNNTSALQINNTGLGPALYVSQGAGPGDIASFYDGDGIEVLHIGNALNPISEGVIGIKTSNPNKTLTVAGEISASGEVWASKFYGDGSNLTGIVNPGGLYLPLSGGNLTQPLAGTTATFNTSISAPALSGAHFGDGSRLTGIVSPVGTYIPLSGGTLTGGLTGITSTFTDSISAVRYFGDGSNLIGVAKTNIDTTKLSLSGGTLTGTLNIAAGTSTSVPILLQTGTITTSPTAHAVEWDGSQLYVTNSVFNRRKISYADETVTTFSSNPANFATNTFYADTQEIHYYTVAATNNFIIDVVGSGSITYNNMIQVNSCRTICILNTSGATAYAPILKIDGTTQVVKWQGNQSSGSSNSLDAWTFTIIKTGTSTYTVLGSITTYI